MGPIGDAGRLNTMVGFIYDALPQQQLGRASAAALILFGIIFIVTMINLYVSKKKIAPKFATIFPDVFGND